MRSSFSVSHFYTLSAIVSSRLKYYDEQQQQIDRKMNSTMIIILENNCYTLIMRVNNTTDLAIFPLSLQNVSNQGK